MDTRNENREMLSPYVSADCVLLGTNDDKLTVLLTERESEEGELIGYKLPDSLIYESENLDGIAYRILNDSAGLKRIRLKQFRYFGSPARTSNRLDVVWPETTSRMKVGRLITVAYLALYKSSRKMCPANKSNSIHWCPIDDLSRLPFDHKEIIKAAIREIRNWIEKKPVIIFDHMPMEFTTFQLRCTYEIIYNREMDVRSFYKEMNSLDYVVPTESMQGGAAYRAARYYRFDKVKHSQQRSKFNKV